MTTDSRSDDPALKDVAWLGYDPRAMAPVVVAAAVVTVLIHWARWALEDASVLIERVGGLAVFALNWVIWLSVAAVFLYRTVTYTYRLTDRALLVDFGFVFPPVAPVVLAEVVSVASGSNRLRRWLGVGWVEVRTADRAVRMIGIRKPLLFAEKIRSVRAANRVD